MILVEVLSILELEVVVSNLLVEEEIQSSKMEIFFSIQTLIVITSSFKLGRLKIPIGRRRKSTFSTIV